MMSYWAPREGMTGSTPFGVIEGPKVMTTNEWAGSGGDLTPWLFRRMEIGPLVGKRTWAGLVGIGGYRACSTGGLSRHLILPSTIPNASGTAR